MKEDLNWLTYKVLFSHTHKVTHTHTSNFTPTHTKHTHTHKRKNTLSHTHTHKVTFMSKFSPKVRASLGGRGVAGWPGEVGQLTYTTHAF